jgi:pSer/pThr/pTyr-binding forkhead associated (FHA) protein
VDIGWWTIFRDSGKLEAIPSTAGKEHRMAPNDNGRIPDEVSAETTAALPDDDLAELDGLSPSSDEDAAESDLEGLPSGAALLIVKRGPNAGARFLLDRDVTSAGRHPDSDIFLDDITVSRRHAEVRRESGEFHITDAGSLNGTYINRQPVDSAVLANHDEIQIGTFRLVFLIPPTTR